MIEEFQVRKDDLAKTRTARCDFALQDGEILARIDRFALTANNVTYGVVGERIGYWKFFPAEGGWGQIPVWGFADIVESRSVQVKPGERLYGYLPMATHLVMRPDRVKPERLIDGAVHRAELPPVYNAYSRVNAGPKFDPALEDPFMLLFPLYATSFCLYDFLLDNRWFGADQVVIGSASSKTAIGLAYALEADDTAPQSVGLTSRRNLEFVEALGLYDRVVGYDDLGSIAKRPTAIVDMSGDGKVISDLHARLGDDMKYTSNVGITHYENAGMGPDFIRERSAMFFAPGHIEKRGRDWGPGAFETKALAFWRDAAVKSRAWLKIERIRGFEGLETAWGELLGGRASPQQGLIAVM